MTVLLCISLLNKKKNNLTLKGVVINFLYRCVSVTILPFITIGLINFIPLKWFFTLIMVISLNLYIYCLKP